MPISIQNQDKSDSGTTVVITSSTITQKFKADYDRAFRTHIDK